MKEYGPLINLWEGANQGEGYLRYAKPTIVNIHSKNWQVNAIRNLQNKHCLKKWSIVAPINICLMKCVK